MLFPNTPKDGATPALEKARRSAAATFIHHDGKNIPLSGFSSVLTQYAPGEPAAALLQRADETLTPGQAGRLQPHDGRVAHGLVLADPGTIGYYGAAIFMEEKIPCVFGYGWQQ